jgi:hypothetical protein
MVKFSTDKKLRSVKSQSIASLQLPLVEMIQRKLIEEGGSLSTFADRHQVSHSMLNSVVNSTRWVAHSDKDTVVRPLARLLGVPVVTIYIKAGLLTHQDFVLEETLETRLSEAYDAMAGDQTLMAVLPASKEAFMQWPTEARCALALLYQTFTRKELLDMAAIEQTIVQESEATGQTAVPPRARGGKSADSATDGEERSKSAGAKTVQPAAPLSIQDVTRWLKKPK